MSFVVSINGQFRPYELPDLTHYNKVRNVFESGDSKKVYDDEVQKEKFENEFKRPKKAAAFNAAGAYKKVDNFSKKEKVPHLAKDIMSTNVHFLKDNQKFNDLLELKNKFNFRHFPILNKDNTLVGIVSDRDIINITGNPEISSFMSKEVLTTFDTTRIQDIANIMLYEKFSALPVINHKNVLCGIITVSDILRFVTKIISIDDLV